MVLHAAHGDGHGLVPTVIGVVIIIGGKRNGPRLRGIRGPFLRQPHIGLGFYAVKAAVPETDAAREEREARGVAALPRAGLDRGGPPPECQTTLPRSSHANHPGRFLEPGHKKGPPQDKRRTQAARSCQGTRASSPMPPCRTREGSPSPQTSDRDPRSGYRSTKGHHCSSTWSSPSAPRSR